MLVRCMRISEVFFLSMTPLNRATSSIGNSGAAPVKCFSSFTTDLMRVFSDSTCTSLVRSPSSSASLAAMRICPCRI